MKLVFASNNKNKILEIQQLVPNSIQILSLEEIGCTEDIPETADTIEGNAILKANYITQKYGYPCFADDTGLEVEALNGAPGVYSARYAGEQKDANDNMDKLLLELKDKSNRNANFKTVICLNLNGIQQLFTGIITGKIIEEKLDRPVKKLMSGPMGGDQQIGAMIASGDIDMVFFFFDPMEAQPHDSDVKALLRLVVAWNLPMACDRTTADFLITSKFMQEVYEYKLPDYTHYLSRSIEKP